jgi:DNA invertase Pin-like site-specific DNA recombinase
VAELAVRHARARVERLNQHQSHNSGREREESKSGTKTSHGSEASAQMTTLAPIHPHHRERLAVFYGRQSTSDQVKWNVGSAEYQRRQTRFAREWGWSEGRIQWHDDFGLTGAAAEHRPQYREMRRLVQAGLVGLVGVADLSRLGRDAAELLSFLADCIAHDTLVAIDGKISNPRDAGDWLFTAIFAILSQHGALNIRDTLQRGRLGQLEAGKAVTHPPVGYTKNAQGKWVLTSDLRVRSAISTVFRVLLEEQTLRAAVIRLRELQVEIPVRGPDGTADFREPDIGRVYRIAQNRNYTPDYHYRQRVIDLAKSRTPRGDRRVRRANADEVIVIEGHHEGYITRDQHEQIKAIFRRNSWARYSGDLGHDNALVHPMVRCAAHREWQMRVHYSKGRGSPHDYHCEGDYKIGKGQCRTLPGRVLDDAVLRAVVSRLSPPSLEAVQETLQRVLADASAEKRHQQIETVHLRQEEADLTRKLDALDPDSFQVFKHFERRLEEVKQHLGTIERSDATAREGMARQYSGILGLALELAPDIERILNASTTSNPDRKKLVHIMVGAVVVDEQEKGRLSVRIRWNDHAPDALIDVWLPAGVERLILALWQEGKKSDEIARVLNDAGIKTNRGNLWNRNSVCDFRRWRLSRRRADRRRAEKLAET